MRHPASLTCQMKPAVPIRWCVHITLAALLWVGCGPGADSPGSDGFDVSDDVLAPETDSRDSHVADTRPDSECSDTATERPITGCPCTNQPGVPPHCCTRISRGEVGWQCDGLSWYVYSLPSCDGNPATCPECPLCPEAWEPDR